MILYLKEQNYIPHKEYYVNQNIYSFISILGLKISYLPYNKSLKPVFI